MFLLFTWTVCNPRAAESSVKYFGRINVIIKFCSNNCISEYKRCIIGLSDWNGNRSIPKSQAIKAQKDTYTKVIESSSASAILWYLAVFLIFLKTSLSLGINFRKYSVILSKCWTTQTATYFIDSHLVSRCLIKNLPKVSVKDWRLR